MRTPEEQNEAGLTVCACIGLAVFMLCVFARPAKADIAPPGGLDPVVRSLDVVNRLEDVPEGKCMYVDIAPPPDRLVFPKRVLVCNTLNVIGVVDYK